MLCFKQLPGHSLDIHTDTSIWMNIDDNNIKCLILLLGNTYKSNNNELWICDWTDISRKSSSVSRCYVKFSVEPTFSGFMQTNIVLISLRDINCFMQTHLLRKLRIIDAFVTWWDNVTSCPNKKYHEHWTRTTLWQSTIVKFWQTHICYF